MRHTARALAWLLVALLCLAPLVGCSPDADEGDETSSDPMDTTDGSEDASPADESDPADDTSDDDGTTSDEPADDAAATDWLDIELTDSVTGETFRISDYKGQPVLLHSFAVW